MYVDFLDVNNYGSYNITLAQIIGLSAAVYCAELISIYKKAQLKNKLVDNVFFKVDRKYISKRTSLSIEQQLDLDLKMSSKKMLKKHPDNSDTLAIDLKLIASIIANEDISIKENLAETFNKSASGIKSARRKRKIEELKENINCSIPEVKLSLEKWVDAVMSDLKNKLSSEAIEIFQDELYRYTNGDPELAIRIIKIATIQKYVSCQWAINIYEKDLKIQKQNNIFATNRINNIGDKKATLETLGKEIF